MLQQLINRLFRMEEINGGTGCPTYLYRWTLFSLGERFKVYLHHIVRDDVSREPHDHPKRFISIGLKGSYIEETMPLGHKYVPYSGYGPHGCRYRIGDLIVCLVTESKHGGETVYHAPWVRSFPAEHIHRIRLIDGKPCWTLCITFKPTRAWGFWVDGKWVHWRRYLGRAAKNQQDC